MTLEAHPEIEMIEENDARFHVQGAVTRELDLRAVSDHAVADGRRMTGYKAPRDSHRLEDVVHAFSLIRIVWVEREIRQTVSSMLDLGGAGTSWAAIYAPREIGKHIARTDDEKARELLDRASALEDERSRAAAFATLCWLVKREQRLRAEARYASRLLRVDYDALTGESPRALRRMLAFLDLPWNASVLNHPKVIADVMRPGKSDPHSPIDAGRRDKWRSRLSQADLEVIEHYRQLYEPLGEDGKN